MEDIEIPTIDIFIKINNSTKRIKIDKNQNQFHQIVKIFESHCMIYYNGRQINKFTILTKNSFLDLKFRLRGGMEPESKEKYEGFIHQQSKKQCRCNCYCMG